MVIGHIFHKAANSEGGLECTEPTTYLRAEGVFRDRGSARVDPSERLPG